MLSFREFIESFDTDATKPGPSSSYEHMDEIQRAGIINGTVHSLKSKIGRLSEFNTALGNDMFSNILNNVEHQFPGLSADVNKTKNYYQDFLHAYKLFNDKYMEFGIAVENALSQNEATDPRLGKLTDPKSIPQREPREPRLTKHTEFIFKDPQKRLEKYSRKARAAHELDPDPSDPEKSIPRKWWINKRITLPYFNRVSKQWLNPIHLLLGKLKSQDIDLFITFGKTLKLDPYTYRGMSDIYQYLLEKWNTLAKQWQIIHTEIYSILKSRIPGTVMPRKD